MYYLKLVNCCLEIYSCYINLFIRLTGIYIYHAICRWYKSKNVELFKMPLHNLLLVSHHYQCRY